VVRVVPGHTASLLLLTCLCFATEALVTSCVAAEVLVATYFFCH
jgi:hypothetical protein